jgi:hypothetical protein
MQKILVMQHMRFIQKQDKLRQTLEASGLSAESIIQKQEELQQLYEIHLQLNAELCKNAESYYKLIRTIRKECRLKVKRNKIEKRA